MTIDADDDGRPLTAEEVAALQAEADRHGDRGQDLREWQGWCRAEVERLGGVLVVDRERGQATPGLTGLRRAPASAAGPEH